MIDLSKKLHDLRRQKGYTQAEVAEKLNVSFQAVSLWERGETCPDIDNIVALADLYSVSTDALLRKTAAADMLSVPKPQIFDEKRMSTYISTYAGVKGMTQTVKALPFARSCHEDQLRKDGKVPYIYHPLTAACHALAMGLEDDSLVAACLLHDVCEDCGVAIDDLPVDEKTKEIVALVTKDSSFYSGNHDEYYKKLYQNPRALMVKLLDRAQNVSGMVFGFKKEKLAAYINETETVFYPMMQAAKTDYPQYKNALFLIKYQMMSVVETIKQLMK